MSKSLPRGKRVVGGTYAPKNSHPWLVRLTIRNKSDAPGVGIRCSGSIIDNEWILTAAHCCDDAYSITINVGEHDATNHSETGEFFVYSLKIITLENFERNGATGNDLCMIKVSDLSGRAPASCNDLNCFAPICLPEKNFNHGDACFQDSEIS